MDVNFEILKGKTITNVIGKVGYEQMMICCSDGSLYKMFHEQDCCESVYIEDICGDIDDIIGSEILLAEKVTSIENPENISIDTKYQESFTWTFYKLATNKGAVTIRWYGSSNGCYSENVTFMEMGE